MGTHATKLAKSLSNKYGQNLLDNAKKSTTDVIKVASKRAIKKKAEATGDLIRNKIADKITSVSKNVLKNYRMMKQNLADLVQMMQAKPVQRTYQKKDTYLQKKDNKSFMN